MAERPADVILCERCGAIVEARVAQGPAGPFVLTVCLRCQFVRTPYRGPEAASVLERWREEEAPPPGGRRPRSGRR